jgi:hypothetical protein
MIDVIFHSIETFNDSNVGMPDLVRTIGTDPGTVFRFFGESWPFPSHFINVIVPGSQRGVDKVIPKSIIGNGADRPVLKLFTGKQIIHPGCFILRKLIRIYPSAELNGGGETFVQNLVFPVVKDRGGYSAEAEYELDVDMLLESYHRPYKLFLIITQDLLELVRGVENAGD